jgi:hypothetical protein
VHSIKFSFFSLGLIKKIGWLKSPLNAFKMDQDQAAIIIQNAWYKYISLWEPLITCHPGPYCGDWMCAGNCS